MKSSFQPEPFDVLPQVLKWTAIASLIGVLSGTASAAFLAALDWATEWRELHVWIIGFLPLAGLCIGWVYFKIGRNVEAGNNLLIDEIHNPQRIVPLRMTPLVLLGSIITHFFGGSAGREGTAIQMGGSLADQICQPLGLTAEDRRVVLMAGMSGGFASVFGTPLAGTVFGLEVLAIGRLQYDAIFPCLIAALIGNQVTVAWGIHHAHYQIPVVPYLNNIGLLYAMGAGAAFGIVGMLFGKATHGVGHLAKKYISYPPFRPVMGGVVVALLVWGMGTTRYIGLGLPVIRASFTESLPPWDFAGKFLMTVLTLGFGFKGGEVTPLFFIGAALGNTLSRILPLPLPLLAGMGFVAVFAGAANTPLACTLMAMELFGQEPGLYMMIACVVSYLFSGHAGLYRSQRIGSSKYSHRRHEEGLTLRELQQAQNDQVVDLNLDLSSLGFLIIRRHTVMNNRAALRVYYHNKARVKRKSRWKNLWASALGSYLASEAKAAGIEQVVLHRVAAGYLPGDRLTHDISDMPSEKFPQCIEFVDVEPKLRKFLEHHNEQLAGTRAILLRVEDVILDTAEK